MSRPLVEVIVQAQILDEDSLREFRKWGLPIDVGPQGTPLETHEEIMNAIYEALDSHEQVEIRETDLHAVELWRDAKNHQNGTLVLKHGEERASNACVYCVAPNGDIIIPWTGGDITDILTNGNSYLRINVDGNPRRHYFCDAKELFFGEKKAFVACKPDRVDT